MHPGNLLFSPDDELGRPGRGRIGLVDLGLVAVLTDDEAANYIGFLRAVGEGDGGAAADCVLRWGVPQQDPAVTGPAAGESAAGFRAAVIASFAKVCRGYGTNIQLGQVLQVVLTHLRQHQISIGANYATLVINALCLEGMARALVPTYNVMDGAQALLTAHGILTRRVPHKPLRRWIIRRALPIARMFKRMRDRAVLRGLRRAAPREHAAGDARR
jgi:aarF domain-containing kinase